ncbi:calcium-dependent serine proteinase-like isoform X1 [Polypterus senegalus]|nr:calcium-dependent serine proteinase-like isoform X1 [Polypterus senegalus]
MKRFFKLTVVFWCWYHEVYTLMLFGVVSYPGPLWNLNNEWNLAMRKISIPQGYTISLHFQNVKLKGPCANESIQIFPGNTDESLFVCSTNMSSSSNQKGFSITLNTNMTNLELRSPRLSKGNDVSFLAHYFGKDIDECQTNPCSYFCTNTIGGFTCHCPLGYRIKNDKVSCEVIDHSKSILHGQLFSPDFPRPYPGGSKYAVNITVLHGFYITISVTHMDIDESENCTQDVLQVLQEGKLISALCGTKKTDIQIKSNSAELNFISRGTNKRRHTGFLAHYKAEDINECEQLESPCFHICVNEIGGFRCICPPGQLLLDDGSTCQAQVPCPTHVVPHSLSEPSTKEYKTGLQILVRCEEGFEARLNTFTVSEFWAVCETPGKWRHGGFHCSLVSCGVPTLPSNGYFIFITDQNVTTFQSIIQYNCTQPFYSLNSTSYVNFSCGADGIWRNNKGEMKIPECNAVCGKPSNPLELFQRVFGGKEAKEGNFPWQVLFLNPLGGGALISDQWVVTAAHVVEADINEIYAGVINIHEYSNASKLHVAKKLIHPNYTNTNFDNDIALVRLKEKVTFGPLISPICLPKRSETDLLETGTVGFISGWGLRELNQLPNSLLYAMISVQEMNKCRNVELKRVMKKLVLSDNMFCAGLNGADSCSGDSGGAFAVQDEKNVFHIEGIVSWGIKCGAYGVYTKVGNYLDWIEETISTENIR